MKFGSDIDVPQRINPDVFEDFSCCATMRFAFAVWGDIYLETWLRH